LNSLKLDTPGFWTEKILNRKINDEAQDKRRVSPVKLMKAL